MSVTLVDSRQVDDFVKGLILVAVDMYVEPAADDEGVAVLHPIHSVEALLDLVAALIGRDDCHLLE